MLVLGGLQELEATNSDYLVKVLRLESDVQVMQKTQETMDLYRAKVC